MKNAVLRILTLLFLLTILCVPALADRADLEFSLASGFYEFPMPLEITCGVKGAKIYYTTDGTVPDETDILYDGTITLMWTTDKHDPLSQITGITLDEAYVPPQDFPSAHVIRAVAIMPEGSRSEVVSGTFFIGYNRQELFGDLPVVSIMIEPDYLFDYETGIYVTGQAYDTWIAEQTEPFESWQGVGNYTMRGKEWERPVLLEFLPAQGEGFRQDMGVRIKGGASRGNAQKSLRFIARSDYGEKNVKYVLFPENEREYDGKIIKKYKTFTLRNGGNDCGFGRIRDPFIARLATGLRFVTADNRACVAFINGEYWGVYTINEEYSDNFIEEHYDINSDHVIIVKTNELHEGQEEDFALYEEMFDFIANSDMTVPENYARACELLDMESFVDYCALHIYIDNRDGVLQSNNWAMWRVREPGEDDSPYADGKWRMMAYDLDFSSGIYDGGSNFSFDTLNEWLSDETEHGWRHISLLFRSLVKNDQFRQDLAIALCDIRNLYFSKFRTTQMLDQMEPDYVPYMPDTLRRFGPQWVTWNPDGHYRSNFESIGTYFEGRYSRFPDLMKKTLGLSSAATITFKLSDPSKGAVYVNGRTLPVSNLMKCKYFPDFPISVTAVPAEGATFVGWEVSNSYTTLSDPSAETTSVTFTRSFTITAIFE